MSVNKKLIREGVVSVAAYRLIAKQGPGPGPVERREVFSIFQQ